MRDGMGKWYALDSVSLFGSHASQGRVSLRLAVEAVRLDEVRGAALTPTRCAIAGTPLDAEEVCASPALPVEERVLTALRGG
jgi:hypothetical protein